jgi:formate dehydrogenase iron-sulfur subunit
VRGFGTDKSYKCTLCFDRTGNGLAPACVKTCPTGALSYVDKDAVAGLSDAAKKKGLTVYGGKDNSLDTHVVFFLDGTPKEYGLPDKPAIPTSTFLWRTVMRPIGIVAFLAAVAAAAVHYMAIGPKDSGEGGEH